MRHEEYPLCCGGAIINDFGNTQTTGGTRLAVDPKYVDDYLNRVLFAEPPELDDDIDYFNVDDEFPELVRNHAFVQIALNETQRTVLHDVIVKHGFTPSPRMFHPGHASWITLYTRINHPDRRHPDDENA